METTTTRGTMEEAGGSAVSAVALPTTTPTTTSAAGSSRASLVAGGAFVYPDASRDDDEEEEEDGNDEQDDELDEEDDCGEEADGEIVEQVVAGTTDAAAATDVKAHAEHFPATFPSWEALDEFIQEFKATTYQMFTLRTGCPVARRNSDLRKRKWHTAQNEHELIPDEWKFYRRVYGCTHAATVKRSQGRGIRNRTAFRGTGCTARIAAVVKYNREARCHYIGVNVTGFHNHPCDREQFFAYTENRRITEPAILNKIRKLVERGLRASEILVRVTKIVREIKGDECTPTRKDMDNLISRMKADMNFPRSAPGRPAVSTAVLPSAGRQESDEGMTAEEQEEETTGGQDDDEEGNRDGWSSAESRPNKRKADELTLSDTEDAELMALRPRKGPGLKLSRLQAILNSPYSYLHAHEDIGKVITVRAEPLSHTVSGFRHDIIPVTRSLTAANDVDFVLPKYVLHGCETGVINHCKYHKLTPPLVGVRLPVSRLHAPRDEPASVVTLGSHQLRAMKQFYLARQNILDVKRSIDWVSTATFRTCPPPPLDDHFYDDKEAILLSMKLLPLSRTVVRGRNITGGVAQEFTDSIFGVNVLKFGSNANVDIDCVKAAILALHARFHATTSFICPTFNFEPSFEASRAKARAYGAFTQRKDYIAGTVQLVSRQWGSFFLSWSKKTCYVYATSEDEFKELQALVEVYLREFAVRVTFEYAPSPPVPPTSSSTSSSSSSNINNSGVLALLFLEMVLMNKTWEDMPLDSIEYFRVRYLMQAILIVNKQDVHDIQWL